MTATPAAMADRQVSVGYTSTAALRGLHVVTRIPALRTAQVTVPSAAAMRALRGRPGIRFVERVRARVATGAPTLPSAPAWQIGAAHVDAVPGWVLAAASSVTVAVVDTGADVTVPSLAAKTIVPYSVGTRTNAVVDAIGHGTFVASLTAAFSGDARLMIVQANRGGTTFSDLDEADAIVWAVDHGARIVNLSIGGRQSSRSERDAIEYATARGALLVAAAGNAAQSGNPAIYPAALIGREGLVVGAATKAGTRAPFSSTGPWVDVLAPGVDVLGALAPGVSSTLFTPAATTGAGGAYGIGTGTSYAAPEVAGAAALVWAANPLLTATAVAETIAASASGVGVWTTELGWGDVDVAAAVQQAIGGSAPHLVQPQSPPAKVVAKPTKRSRPRPTGRRR